MSLVLQVLLLLVYVAVILLVIAVFFMLLFGRVASTRMIRRRRPDPEIDPADLGLPAEPVTFISLDNLTQLGGFWIPASDARGTIVLACGRRGSLDGELPVFGPMFHRAGYNLLAFDWRAHGRSEGRYVTYGVYEKEDLLGALDFLEETYGVTHAGIMGLSMGARTGFITAALTDRVSALVCDSLPVRLHTGLALVLSRRGVPVWLSRLLSRWAMVIASFQIGGNLFHTDATYWVQHVIGVPVFFIHGEDDTLVLNEEIEDIFSRLPGTAKSIWRVPNAGHREVYAQDPKIYTRRVLDWFEEYM